MLNKKLIVGLGNPGKDYAYTRHNLGFLAVENLAKRYQLKFSPSSLTKAIAAEGTIEGQSVILLLPTTYMNNSGVAVKPVVFKKDIACSGLLVVCDDLDIHFGLLRLRAKGSDGGHNGLTSIIGHLGTEDFPRLRLGIGRPKSRQDTVDFVLEEFNKSEKKELPSFIEEATDCCLVWLKNGINKAMEQFNRRKNDGKNSIKE